MAPYSFYSTRCNKINQEAQYVKVKHNSSLNGI